MSIQYGDLHDGDAGVDRLPEALAPPTTPIEYVRDDEGDRHDYVRTGESRVLGVDLDGVETVLPVNDCLFDAHKDSDRARETVERTTHAVVAFPNDEVGDVMSGGRAAELLSETVHEDGDTLYALFLLPVPSVDDDLVEFHQFALVDELGDREAGGFESYRVSGHAEIEYFRERVRDRARHAIGGPSSEMEQLLREIKAFVTGQEHRL